LVLLLGGTVFMFGAYVVLRETILHVLYAAACASATAYPAYVLGISQTIIGDRHGLVLGAATALGTWSCLSVVCMHARNKLAPKPWLYGSLVLLAASLLSTWPGFPVQHIHRLWAAFVLVGLGQMVWTLVDSLRTNFKTIPFNHQLSLLSWPVAIAVATPDVLNIVGLSRNPLPVRTVPITIFIIMIAEMVSRVLGRILVQMRANAELASRFDRLQEQHREIQVLNAELQRQVHEKAEGLSLALARMATQPDSERIKSGDLLDGRYKLGQVLGAGAMGTVFAARRLGDDKPVAVKLMNGTQSLEGRARLAREAQISTRIAHPHLVTVFDVSVSNEGDLYLVMELVNGPTLRNCTECYGPHLWSMRVLAQVAEGLAALHAVGTIHRDLKPANILLEHSDKPRIVHAKIADFGISTIRDAAHGAHDTEECLTLTRPGHLMGTPVYMAPEIFLDSHAVSPAVDIFSFGILAAELLSQQPPMANPPMGYVLHAVPEAPMIPLKSLCPSVTDPLGVLVDRCRQANPKLRPSALELRDAFLSAAEAYVTSARGIEMTSE
jgi:serine/threonine-protein kinase